VAGRPTAAPQPVERRREDRLDAGVGGIGVPALKLEAVAPQVVQALDAAAVRGEPILPS
jgi:hypothetical protein